MDEIRMDEVMENVEVVQDAVTDLAPAVSGNGGIVKIVGGVLGGLAMAGIGLLVGKGIKKHRQKKYFEADIKNGEVIETNFNEELESDSVNKVKKNAE